MGSLALEAVWLRHKLIRSHSINHRFHSSVLRNGKVCEHASLEGMEHVFLSDLLWHRFTC